MRSIVRAAPFITLFIAAYFALSLGLEAFRALTSPLNGLENRAIAGIVFGIDRIVGLSPVNLLRAAAALAAFKLMIAVILLVYLAERVRGPIGGSHYETLEAALLLVLASTTIAAMAAIIAGHADVARLCALQVFLAMTAAIVTFVEQRDRRITDAALQIIKSS